MVSGEAVAMRKLVIAGYSEQEFSRCYKGTVVGPARMTREGEEKNMSWKEQIIFFDLLQLQLFFL